MESAAELEALRREVAMLRYRCMAAELALYQMADAQRTSSAHADEVLKKVHSLNAQFPLGDGDLDGITRLTLQALRATMPELDNATDAELQARFLAPVKGG